MAKVKVVRKPAPKDDEVAIVRQNLELFKRLLNTPETLSNLKKKGKEA